MFRVLVAAILQASFLLALPAVTSATLPPGGTFIDDNGNPHEGNIEAIAAAGVTLGCGGNLYCPDSPVSRAEMAAFLLRAIGHADHLPEYSARFADVPAGLWYTGLVEHLSDHGITQGCATAPLQYCPSAPVSRAEMAAFILRAIGHDQHLTAYHGYFADIPADAWYTGYVEHLYEHGITLGCGGGNYCPDRAVRRDEMASFIARALGLPPIFPSDPPVVPPPPPPPPPPAGFGDGVWVVGTQVAAGTYRSAAPDQFGCYWERLSGFGGTFAEIIENGFEFHSTIVTIQPGDAGFSSDGCGQWTTNLNVPIDPSSFGDGTWLVSSNLPAGTYRSATPDQFGCYWERLTGFGGSLPEIIENGFVSYSTVVTIGGSDVGFSSDGCGPWTNNLSPVTPSQTSPIGDGTFIVGVDIASGTWQSTAAPEGCYWERLSGFGGSLDEIISNDFQGTAGPAVVTIGPTDAGFTSDGCGTWTRTGP